MRSATTWAPVRRPRSPLQLIGDRHRGQVRWAAYRAIRRARRLIDPIALRHAAQRGSAADIALALHPALGMLKHDLRSMTSPIAEMRHRARAHGRGKTRKIRAAKIQPDEPSTTYASTRVAELIGGIDAEARERIATLVDRSLEKGWQHQTLESKIRDMIGLSNAQVDRVDALRDKLEAAEPGDTVKFGSNSVRVPRDGASEAWIARQTGRFADELVAERAELIADTERSRAIHEGQREGWAEAQADGELATDVERVFNAGEDYCPQCAELDGQTAALGEPYVTEDGEEVDGPPVHPRCDCTEQLFQPRAANAPASAPETRLARLLRWLHLTEAA